MWTVSNCHLVRHTRQIRELFRAKAATFCKFSRSGQVFSAAVSQMTITASERASAEHKKYEIISRSEPSYCSRDCPALEYTRYGLQWTVLILSQFEHTNSQTYRHLRLVGPNLSSHKTLLQNFLLACPIETMMSVTLKEINGLGGREESEYEMSCLVTTALAIPTRLLLLLLLPCLR